MTTSVMEKIKESIFGQMNKCGLQHCQDHLLRVKDNALKAVEILNLENKIDINLLLSICFLHDITYLQKKQKSKFITYVFEGKIVKKILIEFLEQFDISKIEKEIILSACSKHPHSFPFGLLNKKGDEYTKILQDSDTLDFFHQHRIFQFRSLTKKSFYSPIYNKISKVLFDFGIKNLKKYLNYPVLYERIFLERN